MANALTIVAMTGLSVSVGVWMWRETAGGSSSASLAARSDEVQQGSIAFSIEGLAQRGNARVALVEFSDFECGFCIRHANDTYHKTTSELVETGKVRYVFVNAPSANRQHAIGAAATVQCALSVGRFWQLHDSLFRSQKLSVTEVISQARDVGLDVKKFEVCLNSPDSARLVVEQSTQARNLGIRGTPTFLMGTVTASNQFTALRRIVGAQSYEVFEKTLDDLVRDLYAVNVMPPVPC